MGREDEMRSNISDELAPVCAYCEMRTPLKISKGTLWHEVSPGSQQECTAVSTLRLGERCPECDGTCRITAGGSKLICYHCWLLGKIEELENRLSVQVVPAAHGEVCPGCRSASETGAESSKLIDQLEIALDELSMWSHVNVPVGLWTKVNQLVRSLKDAATELAEFLGQAEQAEAGAAEASADAEWEQNIHDQLDLYLIPRTDINGVAFSINGRFALLRECQTNRGPS
jgi:hypothetical protein